MTEATEAPEAEKPSTILAYDTEASGGRHSVTLGTSGTTATGAAGGYEAHALARAPAVQPPSRPDFYAVQKIRAYLREALASLSSALEAEGEIIPKSNAVCQFQDALDALWRHSKAREDEFAEMVQTIQGLFLDREPEGLSASELACVRDVVQRLLEESQLDAQAANELTVKLIQGGLDVFRGLR